MGTGHRRRLRPGCPVGVPLQWELLLAAAEDIEGTGDTGAAGPIAAGPQKSLELPIAAVPTGVSWGPAVAAGPIAGPTAAALASMG